ncbi:MAG: hypothetical protein KIT84_01260 [Labilithrix sp.]|nr:hypothetical protein [Labilithrix sp.]MCW5809614.1 hypothetical protein [Labilithrix sp.]
MPAPYRIASPPEPPRTEEADSYEQMLVTERSRDRRTGALLALLALTLAAIGFSSLKPRKPAPAAADEARQRLELRIARAKRTVEDARTRIDEAQDRFARDLRAAIDAELSPSEPLTACPVSLAEPGRLVRGRPSFPLAVTDRGAVTWSPSIHRVWQDVGRAEDFFGGDNPSAGIIYAEAFETSPIEARLVLDVVLVRTKHKVPIRTSPTTYEPGSVDGIAYVYDWRERRFVCAGEVHATNAQALEYSFNDGLDAKSWQVREPRLDATLEDDLETQVARAITAPNVLYSTSGALPPTPPPQTRPSR